MPHPPTEGRIFAARNRAVSRLHRPPMGRASAGRLSPDLARGPECATDRLQACHLREDLELEIYCKIDV